MREQGDEQRRRREATGWMIALQEQPGDAGLRQQFDIWRQSAANDAAWRELEHASMVIGRAAEAERRVGIPLPPARRTRRSVARWKLAVPAAMAACVTLVFGAGLLPGARADVATGTGETRVVALADGSRATLAPRSAIATNVDGSARTVRLLRGAAYFNVVHDTRSPFRVMAGDAVATDLGTAFEVRSHDNGASVAVREGLVALSCTSGWRDPAPLRPGERAAVDCRTLAHQRGRMAPQAVAGWTRGQLIVRDRPLGEVIDALKPWHHGVLMRRGKGMERRVTGVYDLRDTERALQAIAQAHGTATLQITPWISVVSAD